MKSIYVWLSLALLALVGCEQDAAPLAATNTEPPTITSDKADYAPGELVTLTGSNWQPSESVQIVVDDDGLDIEQPFKRTVTVLANESGTFTDTFNLPNWFVADYKVTATGEVSGATTHTFTDALPGEATVTPGSVAVGSTSTFTVRVTNKSTDVLGSAKVLLPSGYTYISLGLPTIANWTATYNTTARKIELKANVNIARVVRDGSVEVSITATAPTSTGSTIWMTEGWKQTDFSGPANGNSTFLFDTQPIVTVNPACTVPSITTQPAATTKTVGESATFSVVAAGTGLSYQWRKGDSDISGATAATYTIPAVATADAGDYSVKVTGQCGSPVTSNAAALTVNKKTATLALSGLTYTYDGAAKAATVTTDPTGLSGVTVTYDGSATAPRDAGSYAVVATLDNPDYSASEAEGTLVIAQASQALTFTGAPATAVYGSTFDVSVTSGDFASDNPVVLEASGACTLDNKTVTMTSGSGICTLTANQAGDTNYSAAPEVKQETEAQKADQTVAWSDPAPITYGTALSGDQLSASTNGGGILTYNYEVGNKLDADTYTLEVTAAATENYNEASKTVSLTVNQAEQVILWDAPAAITYGTELGNDQLNARLETGDGELSYAPPAGTVLEAGTQRLEVSAAETKNYESAYLEVSLVVNKADAVINVSSSSYTYDGEAHGATGSAEGVMDEDLSNLLDLGESFTNVPGGTASWTFAGGENYNGASGSVEISISKAKAIIDVGGYDGVYDGEAHGATGTATGVKGEALTLNLGDKFTDVPGGAANWSFGGDGNYEAAEGTVDIVIHRADATVDVAGGTYTYDGNAKAATGSAKGVNGETLAGLNLGESFTTVPGGTANWTFTGGANYNDVSGSAEIVIGKADVSVNVVGSTSTYDGSAKGATGTATGAKGEDLGSLLDLGESFTNVPGGTASWTFTGNGNYNAADGTAAIVIEKASQVISFGGLGGKTYGNPTFAVSATGGASGNPVTFAASGNCTVSGSSVAITGAGSCTITASQAGNANYNDAPAVAQSFNIAKADQTISFTGAPTTAVYGTSFSVAASSSVGLVSITADGACSISGTTVTMTSSSGTCNLTATQDGDDNYNSAQATQTTSARPWSFTGFYQPIDMGGVFNVAKGGSAIPVKFSLGGNKGLSIFAAGYPKVVTVTCSTSAALDTIEELSTATTSGLKYDATADQYNYTWKTGSWAGTCRRLDVKLLDGQTYSAYFKFNK